MKECNTATLMILTCYGKVNANKRMVQTFAVDFGVLYSCVIPGSGNLIGGKAVTIKNFAANRSVAVADDYGFKMALGFNPRTGHESRSDRHNTRMGNASLLEKKISEVLGKEKLEE